MFEVPLQKRSGRTNTDVGSSSAKQQSLRPSEDPTAEKPTVVVVSDVRLYREALCDVLARGGCVDVGGSVSSPAVAPEVIRASCASIVLLDMAALSAALAVPRLLSSAPGVKVVALGITDASDEIVACAEAGVVGYVCRGGSVADLVTAILNAQRRELACSASVAGALMRRVARLAAARRVQDDVYLTQREVEVVELVNEGLSNKEIAARLHIQVTTVKNHVHNVLSKLDVRHRGQAAAAARRLGLFVPSRSAV